MYPEVDQILYYNFLCKCSLFSIDDFTQIFYTKMGNFYCFLGVPYKKIRKQLIVPVLAACFSQRETTKITKNQPVQKFYSNNNFVQILYLFIISILYNNHIRLWTVSLFFSVVILQMLEPIYPLSEILWIL